MATELFVVQLVKINNKENIKAPDYSLFVRECTGHWEFSLTEDQ